MKTALISFFAAIAAMIVSYFKGSSSAKQKDKLNDDQGTLKIVADQQQTSEFVNTLTPDELRGELQIFSKDNAK